MIQTLCVIISYMIHNMQVGIDSFAAWDNTSLSLNSSERLRKLVEQIEFADKVGLDLLELENIIVRNSLIQLLQSFLQQPQYARDAYV